MSENHDEESEEIDDSRIADHPRLPEETWPRDWGSPEENKLGLAIQCMVAAIARREKGFDHQRSLEGIGYYADEIMIPHGKILEMISYSIKSMVVPLPDDAMDEVCNILCQANAHRERAREEKNGQASQFIFPFMEELQKSAKPGMAILVEPTPEGLMAIKKMVDRKASFDDYEPPDGQEKLDYLLPPLAGETPEECYQRSGRAAHGVYG